MKHIKSAAFLGREITARQDYFTYFEPNQLLDGAKTGDP